MPMYDRSASTTIEVIDEWADGFGWLAHPAEAGRRASHAMRGEDGVWLFDPIDGPGVDERVAELGPVAGVAVLSNYHGRDAAALADRHEVAVHLPAWMDRVADAVDAPVERYDAPVGEWVPLADAGIEVRTVDPTIAWREAIAFSPTDGTLRIPDMLSSLPQMCVGTERLGWFLLHRLAPPRSALADLEPDRILFGHGEGVSEDAAGALDGALGGVRRTFPRALIHQGPHQLRGVIAALVD